jgi:hypothetical protein
MYNSYIQRLYLQRPLVEVVNVQQIPLEVEELFPVLAWKDQKSERSEQRNGW